MLTLRLILSKLPYACEPRQDGGENPAFDGAKMLTAREADLSPNYLILCPLSEALSTADSTPSLRFLCIRDRAVDAEESQEAMRRIIVVSRNIRLAELFNDVQSIFIQIRNWQAAMQASQLRNEGVQTLLDLSEGPLGNYIAVMDSTFKLLAYTKGVPTDDPVMNKLARLGYHPHETVDRLKRFRRLEQFEIAQGVIVSDDMLISKYVTVKKIFHSRGTYSILAVMLCNAQPYSAGIMDLFHMLMEALQYYVDRDYPADGKSSPVGLLLCDLIERRVRDADEIHDRAAYAGIPSLAHFDLFLLHFNDTMNIPLGRLVSELQALLYHSYVIPYRRRILILNRYDTRGCPGLEARLNAVEGPVQEFSVSCGISNYFTCLDEFRGAYEQATIAIQFGELLKDRSLQYTDIPNHGRRYFFEDYFLYRQISLDMTQFPETFKNSFLYRAAKTLTEYGRVHGIDYSTLLATYLQCDRRATETAAKLHMHRNTVLYHIAKIQELLGVSLDDPEVRIKLQLGFKAAELETQTHRRLKAKQPPEDPAF